MSPVEGLNPVTTHSHSLWCIFGCPNKKPKPRPVQKPRGSGWTATGNPRQFPQGKPDGGRRGR